jgi:hypothetical protein
MGAAGSRVGSAKLTPGGSSPLASTALGLPRDYTIPITAGGSGQVRVGGTRIGLRPDEFAGKAYLDSAKIYLERVGRAKFRRWPAPCAEARQIPAGGKTPKRPSNAKIDRYRARRVGFVVPNFSFLATWLSARRRTTSE